MDYETGFDDSKFTTGSGALHYRHHRGGGKTLIMLHGFAANIRTWKRFVAFLPEELDVYLVDLLGHGGSDAPETEYNITVQVEALHDMINGLGIEEYCLFGHSYGAWAAAVYALRYGAALLVLEDSAGLDKFRQERQLADPGYKEQMMRAGSLTNPRRYVVESMLDSDYSGELLTATNLATLGMPTLILWGSNDDTVDVKYGRIFADSIRGSRLELIEGAGHTPHYTKAAETGRILIDFLNRH